MKTRSVGARARRPSLPVGKALMGLMLSAAALLMAGSLSACGQKRPLQLPPPAKPGTGAPVVSAPKADPASAPASAPIMPQR